MFTCRSLIVILAATVLASAQQPNRPTSGLVLGYRDGGPWPKTVDVPNAGLLLAAVYGAPGAPFALLAGDGVAPAAGGVAGNGDFVDLAGTVTLLGQGFTGALPAYTPWFVVPPIAPAPLAGFSPMDAFAVWPNLLTPGVTGLLPGVQGVVFDVAAPSGLSLTGATRLNLTSPGGVLFIQGVQNPFCFGVQARVDDDTFVGFSQLKLHLLLAGFTTVDEIEHTAQARLTPATLAGYRVVVLAANRTPFDPSEVAALEAFVRGGGGLIALADSLFSTDTVPGASCFTVVANDDAYVADNLALAPFGVAVLPDNFALTARVTSFVDHPTVRGVVNGFEGEGMSLPAIVGGNTGDDLVTLVAPATDNPTIDPNPCGPNPTAGCGHAKNVGALVTVEAGLGRVAVTFDRNTFLNPPGFGTDLYRASNLVYAINLFYWTAGLD
ncbi:MAG TPA: hypothetical protein VEI02_02710 [Planctomycetota bacterium]|nr:hypothetical protein [Planctomycetota bacterium]